ncbi:hypothetical protein AKJ57_01050 [candidate division MSBL1 archaeon SCGC-AAA259A05]|uniref:Uncharacterized protein n=1 Tax=candidate division MSBL1 archaeon SCGC-AAA259A05 TaxID=1698259 RepID=A0A133UBF1_9EURY|nr:hypothetical protein AKJ57_01050 [candidate division MSBL1 archaeon SCGC-AAA259A05]
MRYDSYYFPKVFKKGKWRDRNGEETSTVRMRRSTGRHSLFEDITELVPTVYVHLAYRGVFLLAAKTMTSATSGPCGPPVEPL